MIGPCARRRSWRRWLDIDTFVKQAPVRLVHDASAGPPMLVTLVPIVVLARLAFGAEGVQVWL